MLPLSTRRSSRRQIGVVDYNIANTIPLPPAPAWVSGRFYDSFIFAAGTGTVAAGTNIFTLPFLVPNTVTVTAIGCEVTIAATASTVARFAIWDCGEQGWPRSLLIDGSTVAVDATGFRSVTISRVLYPGLYWVSIAQQSAGTNATFRSVNTSTHAISYADRDAPSGAGGMGISSFDSSGVYAVNGFPAEFFVYTSGGFSNTIVQPGTACPRIMLGV